MHKKYKCATCGAEFDAPPPERSNECVASYYHNIYRCDVLGTIAPNARQVKRPVEKCKCGAILRDGNCPNNGENV